MGHVDHPKNSPKQQTSVKQSMYQCIISKHKILMQFLFLSFESKSLSLKLNSYKYPLPLIAPHVTEPLCSACVGESKM